MKSKWNIAIILVILFCIHKLSADNTSENPDADEPGIKTPRLPDDIKKAIKDKEKELGCDCDQMQKNNGCENFSLESMNKNGAPDQCVLICCMDKIKMDRRKRRDGSKEKKRPERKDRKEKRQEKTMEL